MCIFNATKFDFPLCVAMLASEEVSAVDSCETRVPCSEMESYEEVVDGADGDAERSERLSDTRALLPTC